MKIILIQILLLISLYSCSSEKRQNTNISAIPIDSFESALPHGKTLQSEELSDDDKLLLANANGIQADVIGHDSLLDIISTDNSGLVIYNFWNLDCGDCKKNNDLLQKMQHEVFDSVYMKVVYVNIDNLYPDMVNSYIRENAIVDQVFTVSMDSIDNWSAKIQDGWSGQLPATLIINNNEGLKLFYQKEFSLDELEAVLLPLTF